MRHETITIKGLGEYSAIVFTVEHVFESSGTGVRVRAHCNLHGWSQWTQLGDETTDQGGGILGFSYAPMLIGLTVYLMVTRLRKHS